MKYLWFCILFGLATGLVGRYWIPDDRFEEWLFGTFILQAVFSYHKIVIKKEW